MDVKGPYREGNQATVGSNSRTKLLVQANDQQLGDWQGWKKVVKRGTDREAGAQMLALVVQAEQLVSDMRYL